MGEVRELISEFRQTGSDQHLDVLVGQLLDDWEAQTEIRVHRQLRAAVVLPDSVRYELLMVLSEGLENIQRHSAATRATARLDAIDDHVELHLEDNGTGAPAGRLSEAQGDGHFGVQGMRERITGMGGEFRWQSTPKSGTRLTARVHQQGLIEAGAAKGEGR
jgi:signal transduction histidine kinase